MANAEDILELDVKKSPTAIIRIKLIRYKESDLRLDVREWYRREDDEEEEWKATKKGINIPLLVSYKMKDKIIEALECDEAISGLEDIKEQVKKKNKKKKGGTDA